MVKFYSDVTKKFYEDAAAAEKAEKELQKAQDDKAARRKEMAEKVEKARKEWEDVSKACNKAYEEYKKVLNEFCKTYGSYHYTISNNDIEDFFNNFFRW